MTAGERFQGLVLDQLLILRDAGSIKVELVSEEEDYYYGTDVIVDGVRWDVTLDHKKGNVHWGTGVQTDISNIAVGLRKENSHHEFDEPVMVLQFEPAAQLPAQYNRQWMKLAAAEISPALIEDVSSRYWDLVDELEEQGVISSY